MPHFWAQLARLSLSAGLPRLFQSGSRQNNHWPRRANHHSTQQHWAMRKIDGQQQLALPRPTLHQPAANDNKMTSFVFRPWRVHRHESLTSLAHLAHDSGSCVTWVCGGTGEVTVTDGERRAFGLREHLKIWQIVTPLLPHTEKE